MLTIDIWMYQNRASSCCMEARFILGCVDPAPAPCRGFTGDCSDLPSQFANVVPNPFEGYVRQRNRSPPGLRGRAPGLRKFADRAARIGHGLGPIAE